jgi:hypothetical protein
MAKLDVEVSAYWTGAVANFNLFPVRMAVSVAADGEPVTGLRANDFVVREFDDFASGVSRVMGIRTFKEHTQSAGPVALRGFYTFLMKPTDEGTEVDFRSDSTFLFARVKHAGNQGQAVCHVSYDRRQVLGG